MLIPIALLAATVFAPTTPAALPVTVQDSQDASAMVLPSAKDADDPALAKMGAFIKSVKIDKQDPRWKTNLPKPPKLEFTEGVDYFWNLKTNKGVISVQFMPDTAPMHVSSTIYLTRAGFYNGIKFHRVITGFMAQAGCPLGRGTGNPGYKYAGEFDPSVKHDRPGLLSMANSGPDTDGSQFFLTFVPTPHLNGKHTIFGEVTEGSGVVKKLEQAGSQGGATREPLLIEEATISIKKKDALPAEKAAGGDATKK
jgi:cyclophilin family peptidyl-prolyl cis-trans isomerase